jgi:hypothetical protein
VSFGISWLQLDTTRQAYITAYSSLYGLKELISRTRSLQQVESISQLERTLLPEFDAFYLPRQLENRNRGESGNYKADP